MTRGRTTTVLGSGLLAGSLLLAGCGAEPASAPTSSASGEASAEPAEPSSEPSPSETGLFNIAAGPLSEIVHGPSATTAQDVVAQTAALENALASCMKEQGFDYSPQIPGVADVVMFEGLVPDSREFVEEYGFGVWNVPGEVAGGFRFDVPANPEANAYLAGMSEAEREAYETALEGPVVGDTGARGGGCRDQVLNVTSTPENAFATEILADASEFLVALPVSSAFDELNAEWATCMRDLGYDEASPHLAFLRFREEYHALAPENGQPDSVTVEEHAPEEVAVATGDLDCREAMGYEERARAISHAEQTAYIEAHRADIAAVEELLAPLRPSPDAESSPGS